LFLVQALSAVFRGKFLETLHQWLAQGRLKLAGSTAAALASPLAQQQFIAALRATDWVVYAKQTLAGPQQVLDYLARYTHKTAISNQRLIGLDHDSVRFVPRPCARQPSSDHAPARSTVPRALRCARLCPHRRELPAASCPCALPLPIARARLACAYKLTIDPFGSL
jgi:hypothetical protein